MARCQSAVCAVLKKGVLVKPAVCEDCGQERQLEAHHLDYSRPLDVSWLCLLCHGREHSWLVYTALVALDRLMDSL